MMANVVIIAGGFRSGSTLQYNLLGEYVEHAGLGRRIGYVNPDESDAVVVAAAVTPGLMVAKCHTIAPGFHAFERAGAWGDHVRSGAAVAVLTHREQAGTERSMCRKFDIRPEDLHSSAVWHENNANLALWRPLAVLDQEYADLTERPKEALAELLRTLQVRVKRRSIRHAVAATSVERVAQHQRTIEPGTWDPVTLVHWDHIAEH